MISIWSLLPVQLQNLLAEKGYKKFRSSQILKWVYKKNTFDFQQMTDLDKKSRDELSKFLSLELPLIESEKKSSDNTRKLLLSLNDNNFIEMVLIPQEGKLTLCLSSQVGCRRNCRFCATARLGFIRHLTVAEIISQIVLARLLAFPDYLTNLVFMGMGEPLDNLDNVIKALEIIQNEKCLAFSPRRITISTCGIVSQIKKLSQTGIKVKLAVSLNAAIDEKRSRLMPVNNIYPLADLKDALKTFQQHSPHRITLEYVLIKNLNMTSADISALRKFSGDLSCKINLIPFNDIKKSPWQSPTPQEVENFRTLLMQKLHAAVTLRNSRGLDIDAACGMLAGKKVLTK